MASTSPREFPLRDRRWHGLDTSFDSARFTAARNTTPVFFRIFVIPHSNLSAQTIHLHLTRFVQPTVPGRTTSEGRDENSRDFGNFCLGSNANSLRPGRKTHRSRQERRQQCRRLGSLDSDTGEAIGNAFSKKTGIRVDYWRASSTKVMDRAMSEYRAGKPLFDVVINNASPMQILFERRHVDQVRFAFGQRVFQGCYRSKSGSSLPKRGYRDHLQQRSHQACGGSKDFGRSRKAPIQGQTGYARSEAKHDHDSMASQPSQNNGKRQGG